MSGQERSPVEWAALPRELREKVLRAAFLGSSLSNGSAAGIRRRGLELPETAKGEDLVDTVKRIKEERWGGR